MIGIEFYPTPQEVALKMLNKIQWEGVKNVLEPSVGKGDIIETFSKGIYVSKKPQWYGCEIDPTLRKIVTGCELIGFDFLAFEDKFLHFDAIIMNPPFSNGIDHLMKAWEITNKGQIVCLLNAETIRNPHTQKRKDLVDLIEKYGRVEYMGNCFSEAERETEVEVAMIYLKKDNDIYRNIFEGFKEDLLSDYNSGFKGIIDNELVKKGDMETLLAYNKIIKKQVVETAISRAKLGHYMKNFGANIGNTYYGKEGIGEGDFREEIENGVKNINRQCWGAFFTTYDAIRGKVTTQVYRDFIGKYSQSTMDFTQSNIDYTIQAILGSTDEINNRNMEELFDTFIKYADDKMRLSRKTNYGYKIGKKVILPYMCELGWNKGEVKIRYDMENKLTDIEKVLCNLDAKDFNNIYSVDRLRANRTIRAGEWYEFELFKIKFFLKGTVHIEFNEQSLVDRFNFEVAKSKKWVYSEYK